MNTLIHFMVCILICSAEGVRQINYKYANESYVATIGRNRDDWLSIDLCNPFASVESPFPPHDEVYKTLVISNWGFNLPSDAINIEILLYLTDDTNGAMEHTICLESDTDFQSSCVTRVQDQTQGSIMLSTEEDFSSFIAYPNNTNSIKVTIEPIFTDAGSNAVLSYKLYCSKIEVFYDSETLNNQTDGSSISEPSTTKDNQSEESNTEITASLITTQNPPNSDSIAPSTDSTIPSSDDIQSKKKNNKGTKIGIAVGVSIFALCLAFLVVAVILYRRKRKQDTGHQDLELHSAPQSITQSEGNSLDSNYVPFGSSIYTPRDSATSSRNMNITKDWYIPFSELKMEEEIGRGAFGVVWRAKWRVNSVAVKRVLTENMNEKDIKDFHHEMFLMKNLRPSPNVVSLLGVCDEPLCAITEYYEKGSLRKLLLSSESLSVETMNKIALGIAKGMLHLHFESVVHRDLASRNVLLTATYEPKISDFGMSRVVDNDGGKTETNVGPLMWLAPECLSKRTYSKASDVWAYGITLIELYTRKIPYVETGLDSFNVASKVMRGELKPSIPANAPTSVAKIMESCFQYQASKRPSFQQICEILEAEF